VRDEYIHYLYDSAMKLRSLDMDRSSELLMELNELDPNNYESALKLSWLLIRKDNLLLAREVLIVIVKSNESTMNQKQRAYTNIACCWNFDIQPDNYLKAERAARKGIKLNGIGTIKLWENLAVALKKQEKFEEAIDSYENLLKLVDDVSPIHEEIYKIRKLIKKQRKFEKKGFVKSEKTFNTSQIEPIQISTSNKGDKRKMKSRSLSKSSDYISKVKVKKHMHINFKNFFKEDENEEVEKS